MPRPPLDNTWIGFHILSSTFWAIRHDSFSIHNTTQVRRHGIALSQPLIGVNLGSFDPFQRKERVVKPTQNMIRLIVLWGKLKSTKVECKKLYLTLSHAFFRSIFTVMTLCLLLKQCIKCKTSWAIKALFVVSLPGTKLFWKGPMRLFRKGLRRLTNTLVINLYNIVHGLVGQNCFIFVRHSSFEINTIKVSTSLVSKLLVWKTSLAKF